LTQGWPDREIRFFGVRGGEGELSEINPIHYRVAVIDAQTCILSTGSFSSIGGIYSDEFSIVSSEQSICHPVGDEMRRLGTYAGVLDDVFMQASSFARLFRLPFRNKLESGKLPFEWVDGLSPKRALTQAQVTQAIESSLHGL